MNGHQMQAMLKRFELLESALLVIVNTCTERTFHDLETAVQVMAPKAEPASTTKIEPLIPKTPETSKGPRPEDDKSELKIKDTESNYKSYDKGGFIGGTSPAKSYEKPSDLDEEQKGFEHYSDK